MRDHDAADALDEQRAGSFRNSRASECDELVEGECPSFARGGEVGRQRSAEAPWRNAGDFVRRHRTPQRLQENRRIAGRGDGKVIATHNGLERIDRSTRFAQARDQAGGDEGLADVSARGGDKISGHRFRTITLSRTMVASRSIASSGCCAVNAKRRRDVPAGTVGGRIATARKPSFSMRRDASRARRCIANDHRYDRTLRFRQIEHAGEVFCFFDRARGVTRLTLDHVERGNGRGDNRRRQAGRIN